MDGRKAKLSQIIFTELFFDDAVDLSGEITIHVMRSHSGSSEKALPNKTLGKFKK